MALTKITVIDKIEIVESLHVQVRRATYVEEDGVRIAGPMYHRVAYAPGSDVSAEPARIRTLCALVWG